MQSDTFRWTVDSLGDWLCILTKDARRILDTLTPGKTYDVEIKAHRERRSLDANAYAWVLLDRLSAKTGIPRTEVYRSYVREIGGNSETVCVRNESVEKLRSGWEHNGIGWQTDTIQSKLPGCTNVILYYGSSTYDTAQMSRLIDLIVQDCREQGIETLTPQQLDAMKERWTCTK